MEVVMAEVSRVQEIRAGLELVSRLVDQPLRVVLQEFNPGKGMSELLNPYMDEWGELPLIEFVEHLTEVVMGSPSPQPIADILDQSMYPVNVFAVVMEFYYG
jgi:hypothetical protein